MTSTTSNVLATIGTVCWCIQLIPQVIMNYRNKNCEGFPENMALLWCLCVPFFGVFVIAQNQSIPIMIQPHLFGFFGTILYIQIMYYPPVKRSMKEIILRAGGFIVFLLVIELPAVIPLRDLYMNKGIAYPSTIYGAIASILIAVGLILPYFELFGRQGRVVGINFLFLFVDFSGAIFSLASLLVDKDIDIMALVLYVICGALELGIFVSHFIWLLRFKWLKISKLCDEEQDEQIENSSDETGSQLSSVSSTELDNEITRNEVFIQDKKEKNLEKDENDEQDADDEVILTSCRTLAEKN